MTRYFNLQEHNWQRLPIRFFLILIGIKFAVLTASGDQSSPVAGLSARAERGDRDAQIHLGMRYRDGEGVPRDYEKALEWYRKCADQGDPRGMDNVGFMFLRGLGVPVDFDIAAGYFKASARQNHAQGQFNLGNCYFSGQGVVQNYEQAIAAWQRAAQQGHPHAVWRLATLYASGEGLPRDRKKAAGLCRKIAEKGHANGALLLGELLSSRGNSDEARRWWAVAAEHGSTQADILSELEMWRRLDPIAGRLAFVEVDHLYQGWNNCGATSIAMFARHFGTETNPYDVKRLCPRSPIGTGTDWADLLAVGEKVNQEWKLVTFSNDDHGFAEGTRFIRQHLDAGRPVVIDFTYIRERDGKRVRSGHTLLVVGYHTERNQFVLQNPNQPPPGIQLMSTGDLKSIWYSNSYSRLAKGQTTRPLIVMARK